MEMSVKTEKEWSMYQELSKFMHDREDNELGEVAKKSVKEIFRHIKANSQEELNVKSALMKQAFLNQFELCFEVEFLNVSENIQSENRVEDPVTK
jgi:hypothetical protein